MLTNIEEEQGKGQEKKGEKHTKGKKKRDLWIQGCEGRYTPFSF